MKFLYSLFNTAFCVMGLFSQDLPIQNGELEQTSEIGFSYWTNQSIHGSNAIFDVVDNIELFGSTKALRAEVNMLGNYQYSVQTKSDHQFSMDSDQKVPHEKSLDLSKLSKGLNFIRATFLAEHFQINLMELTNTERVFV